MTFRFRTTTHPERGVPMVEILREDKDGAVVIIGTLAGSDDGRALQIESTVMMGGWYFDERQPPTLFVEIEDMVPG